MWFVQQQNKNKHIPNMKIISIVSALVAVLFLAGSPILQADSSTDAQASQSSKHMHYHGTIMAIDMSANTVTIQTSGGNMTMTINADTKFRGGSKTLGDFKVGDTISGTMMTDGAGTMMVVSIKPYNSKA
jgi:hypothetical protein